MSIANLLVDHEAIQHMPLDRLRSIMLAADDCNASLHNGVAAIGNVLACAAINEGMGLNADTIADLGWLLEMIGTMGASVNDLGGAANQQARRRSTGSSKPDLRV